MRAVSQQKDPQDAQAVLDRMRAILEAVADGVYVTDAAGTIRLWNRSAERITGCPPGKAVGRPCSVVLGLKTGNQALDCTNGCPLLESYRKAGGEGVEVHRRRKDGRMHPLLVTVSSTRENNGHKVEFVHTVRDMTSIKQADEAKTMFLATASHELKTPLTVIMGFTEMLNRGILPEDQRAEALRSIEYRARELSKIVDRLLLTGRIEAGRLKLELGPVSVRELITERATTIGKARGREISTDLDEIPPVMGDEDAVATIIDHLVDNAMKYSPDGDSIDITARTVGPNVQIDVVDHGIGMDEHQVARCFDSFWQAESSDVRRFGGTGVGLYIVRSLVKAMGGQIKVASALGAGATFSVSLRRAQPGSLEALPEEIKTSDLGPRSMIEEFMSQIGVPKGGGGS